MWKDFFYFSRGERRGIIALIMLIVFIQGILWTSEFWLPLLPDKLTNVSSRKDDLKAFEDSLSGESYQNRDRGYSQGGYSQDGYSRGGSSRNGYSRNGSSQGSYSQNNSSQYSSSQYSSSQYSKRNYSSFPSKNVRLSAFNPNTADSAKLVSLGLRPYVAKNILKYRRKGGLFRKPEDFARIYGIDPAQFKKLKPYIRLQSENSEFSQGRNVMSSREALKAEKSKAATSNELMTARKENYSRSREILKDETSKTEYSKLLPSKSETFKSPSSKPDKSETSTTIKTPSLQTSKENPKNSPGSLAIEMNTADTTLLQQIKGVGGFTASRITQYRSRLGGFYSIHQLEEIKGIYPDALARLQSLMKVDTTQIVKINANKASLEKLKGHPYLSFYQAKVIVELRKARSGIKNIKELSDFKEFTPADIARLKWYLAFTD